MAEDNEILDTCPMFKTKCWKCGKTIYKKTPFIGKIHYCKNCQNKIIDNIWGKYGE